MRAWVIQHGVCLEPAPRANTRPLDTVGRFAVLQDPQGAVFAVITSASTINEESDPQGAMFAVLSKP